MNAAKRDAVEKAIRAAEWVANSARTARGAVTLRDTTPLLDLQIGALQLQIDVLKASLLEDE